MTYHLFRFFIMGFGITLGLGFAGNHAWDIVLPIAVSLGLYFPLTLVSITTWYAARGRDLEDMVTVFGKNAPEIISSFYEIYQTHKWGVLGTTVLTSLGCAALLGLWFRIQFPGIWSLSPGLTFAFTIGAAFCGTLAGPGFAILGLLFLKGTNSNSEPAKT